MTSADSVTLYGSVKSLVTSLVSPALLILVGAVALASAGPNVIAWVLLVGGAGLAGMSLLDMPRRTIVDHHGIERRCLLRRHRIPWADVRAIEREPDPAARRVRAQLQGDTLSGIGKGGLVARASNRRRYLLCDQLETPLQFERVRAFAAGADTDVLVRARPPA